MATPAACPQQARRNAVLQRAFVLAEECGCEVLVAFAFGGAVQHWATDRLRPMVEEEQGRQMLWTLLSPPEGKGIDAVPRAQWPQSPLWPEVAGGLLDAEVAAAEPVADPARREERFRTLARWLRDRALELSVLSPAPGDRRLLSELVVLIAAQNGKVLCFATPALEPLVKSDAGRGLISALLNAPPPRRPSPEEEDGEEERDEGGRAPPPSSGGGDPAPAAEGRA